MKNLSLETINKILDENITSFNIDKETNLIYYIKEKQIWDDVSKYYKMIELNECFSINIDTFIAKCKKFCYEKGYIILSGYHQNNINGFQAQCFGWVSENIDDKMNFSSDTELNVIIKSLNYIINK